MNKKIFSYLVGLGVLMSASFLHAGIQRPIGKQSKEAVKALAEQVALKTDEVLQAKEVARIKRAQAEKAEREEAIRAKGDHAQKPAHHSTHTPSPVVPDTAGSEVEQLLLDATLPGEGPEARLDAAKPDTQVPSGSVLATVYADTAAAYQTAIIAVLNLPANAPTINIATGGGAVPVGLITAAAGTAVPAAADKATKAVYDAIVAAIGANNTQVAIRGAVTAVALKTAACRDAGVNPALADGIAADVMAAAQVAITAPPHAVFAGGIHADVTTAAAAFGIHFDGTDWKVKRKLSFTTVKDTSDVLHFHEGDFHPNAGFFLGLDPAGDYSKVSDDNKTYALSRVNVTPEESGHISPEVTPIAPKEVTLNTVAKQPNPIHGKGLTHLLLGAGQKPVVVAAGDQTHVHMVTNISSGNKVLTNKSDDVVTQDFALKGNKSGGGVGAGDPLGGDAKIFDIATTTKPVKFFNTGYAAGSDKNLIFAAVADKPSLAKATAKVPGIAVAAVNADHIMPLDVNKTNDHTAPQDNRAAHLDLKAGTLLAVTKSAQFANAGDINLWWDDRYQQLFGTIAGIRPGDDNGSVAYGLFRGQVNGDAFQLKPMIDVSGAGKIASGTEDKVAASIFGAQVDKAWNDVKTGKPVIDLYRPRTMHTSTDKDYLIVSGGVGTGIRSGPTRAWVSALPLVAPGGADAGMLAKKDDITKPIAAAADAPTIARALASPNLVDEYTPFIVGRFPSYLAPVTGNKLDAAVTVDPGKKQVYNTGAHIMPGSSLKGDAAVNKWEINGEVKFIADAGADGTVKLSNGIAVPAGVTLSNGMTFDQNFALGVGTLIDYASKFGADATLVDGDLQVNTKPLVVKTNSILNSASVLVNTKLAAAETLGAAKDPVTNFAIGAVLKSGSKLAKGSVINQAAALKVPAGSVVKFDPTAASVVQDGAVSDLEMKAEGLTGLHKAGENVLTSAVGLLKAEADAFAVAPGFGTGTGTGAGEFKTVYQAVGQLGNKDADYDGKNALRTQADAAVTYGSGSGKKALAKLSENITAAYAGHPLSHALLVANAMTREAVQAGKSVDDVRQAGLNAIVKAVGAQGGDTSTMTDVPSLHFGLTAHKDATNYPAEKIVRNVMRINIAAAHDDPAKTPNKKMLTDGAAAIYAQKPRNEVFAKMVAPLPNSQPLAYYACLMVAGDGGIAAGGGVLAVPAASKIIADLIAVPAELAALKAANGDIYAAINNLGAATPHANLDALANNPVALAAFAMVQRPAGAVDDKQVEDVLCAGAAAHCFRQTGGDPLAAASNIAINDNVNPHPRAAQATTLAAIACVPTLKTLYQLLTDPALSAAQRDAAVDALTTFAASAAPVPWNVIAALKPVVDTTDAQNVRARIVTEQGDPAKFPVVTGDPIPAPAWTRDPGSSANALLLAIAASPTVLNAFWSAATGNEVSAAVTYAGAHAADPGAAAVTAAAAGAAAAQTLWDNGQEVHPLLKAIANDPTALTALCSAAAGTEVARAVAMPGVAVAVTAAAGGTATAQEVYDRFLAKIGCDPASIGKTASDTALINAQNTDPLIVAIRADVPSATAMQGAGAGGEIAAAIAMAITRMGTFENRLFGWSWKGAGNIGDTGNSTARAILTVAGVVNLGVDPAAIVAPAAAVNDGPAATAAIATIVAADAALGAGAPGGSTMRAAQAKINAVRAIAPESSPTEKTLLRAIKNVPAKFAALLASDGTLAKAITAGAASAAVTTASTGPAGAAALPTAQDMVDAQGKAKSLLWAIANDAQYLGALAPQPPTVVVSVNDLVTRAQGTWGGWGSAVQASIRDAGAAAGALGIATAQKIVDANRPAWQRLASGGGANAIIDGIYNNTATIKPARDLLAVLAKQGAGGGAANAAQAAANINALADFARIVVGAVGANAHVATALGKFATVLPAPAAVFPDRAVMKTVLDEWRSDYSYVVTEALKLLDGNPANNNATKGVEVFESVLTQIMNASPGNKTKGPDLKPEEEFITNLVRLAATTPGGTFQEQREAIAGAIAEAYKDPAPAVDNRTAVGKVFGTVTVTDELKNDTGVGFGFVGQDKAKANRFAEAFKNALPGGAVAYVKAPAYASDVEKLSRIYDAALLGAAAGVPEDCAGYLRAMANKAMTAGYYETDPVMRELSAAIENWAMVGGDPLLEMACQAGDEYINIVANKKPLTLEQKFARALISKTIDGQKAAIAKELFSKYAIAPYTDPGFVVLNEVIEAIENTAPGKPSIAKTEQVPAVAFGKLANMAPANTAPAAEFSAGRANLAFVPADDMVVNDTWSIGSNSKLRGVTVAGGATIGGAAVGKAEDVWQFGAGVTLPTGTTLPAWTLFKKGVGTQYQAGGGFTGAPAAIGAIAAGTPWQGEWMLGKLDNLGAARSNLTAASDVALKAMDDGIKIAANRKIQSDSANADASKQYKLYLPAGTMLPAGTKIHNLNAAAAYTTDLKTNFNGNPAALDFSGANIAGGGNKELADAVTVVADFAWPDGLAIEFPAYPTKLAANDVLPAGVAVKNIKAAGANDQSAAIKDAANSAIAGLAFKAIDEVYTLPFEGKVQVPLDLSATQAALHISGDPLFTPGIIRGAFQPVHALTHQYVPNVPLKLAKWNAQVLAQGTILPAGTEIKPAVIEVPAGKTQYLATIATGFNGSLAKDSILAPDTEFIGQDVKVAAGGAALELSGPWTLNQDLVLPPGTTIERLAGYGVDLSNDIKSHDGTAAGWVTSELIAAAGKGAAPVGGYKIFKAGGLNINAAVNDKLKIEIPADGVIKGADFKLGADSAKLTAGVTFESARVVGVQDGVTVSAGSVLAGGTKFATGVEVFDGVVTTDGAGANKLKINNKAGAADAGTVTVLGGALPLAPTDVYTKVTVGAVPLELGADLTVAGAALDVAGGSTLAASTMLNVTLGAPLKVANAAGQAIGATSVIKAGSTIASNTEVTSGKKPATSGKLEVVNKPLKLSVNDALQCKNDTTLNGVTKADGGDAVLTIPTGAIGMTVPGGTVWSQAVAADTITTGGTTKIDIGGAGTVQLGAGSVVAAGSNVVTAESCYTTSATDMQVIGDSVYVGLEGDRDTLNGIESGVFKSTALFDKKGTVRGWTPWQRVGANNDATAFFGHNPDRGDLIYLTSPDGQSFLDTATDMLVNPATTVKLTQWGIGDDKAHGGMSLAKRLATHFASAGNGRPGVFGLFDFDPDTWCFKQADRRFADPLLSCMVATGNERVVVAETGKHDGKNFIPTPKFDDTAVKAFGPADGLAGLGVITCAEFTRKSANAPATADNWLFVGGENGLAVLIDPATGLGFKNSADAVVDGGSAQMIATDHKFIELKSNFGTGVESIKNVRKIVADQATGYVYVVTKDRVLRINPSADAFKTGGRAGVMTHGALNAGKDCVRIGTVDKSVYGAGAAGSLCDKAAITALDKKPAEFTDLLILKSLENGNHDTDLLLATTAGLVTTAATHIADTFAGDDAALQTVNLWQPFEYKFGFGAGAVDTGINARDAGANAAKKAAGVGAVLRMQPMNLQSGGRLVRDAKTPEKCAYEGNVLVFATDETGNELREYRLDVSNGAVNVVQEATNKDATGNKLPYLVKLGDMDPALLANLDYNCYQQQMPAADFYPVLPELPPHAAVETAITAAQKGVSELSLDQGMFENLYIPSATSDSGSGALYIATDDGVRVNE